MKKAIFPTILLCAVTLTGCWCDDDCYTDPDPTAVCTEATTETTAITEPDPEPQEETSISQTAPFSTVEITNTESTVQDTTIQPDPTDPTEEVATEATVEPTESEITDLLEPAEAETSTDISELPTEVPPLPATEPEPSDYDKALEVYAYMLENGHGTCVNFACQTYVKCHEAGLPCYIVWTDAQLDGHVANTVQVDGIWYILDTQGQLFLTYNYGFTEVIDMEMNHVGGTDMLSDRSYAEIVKS